jgi:hypothetical protein
VGHARPQQAQREDGQQVLHSQARIPAAEGAR